MARKGKRSRRRGQSSSSRGGGGSSSRRGSGRGGRSKGPVERTRILGDLPPLPIVTRLLDHLRRKVSGDDFVWQRGLRYAEEARVAYLKLRGNNVEAGVKGSRRYLVSLSWPAGSPERFEGRCTCPYARKGVCKHMVAMAMTLWLSTQKQEEEEAKAELAAAVGPTLVMHPPGRGSEARRPRNGRLAGSALPVWMATLLDSDESVPPPPAEGPSLAIDPEQAWIVYDLLVGHGEPMPVEARVARMGPQMRPTRGRRIYEMDPMALQDLSREVRLLPEDSLALALLAPRSGPEDAEPPPWDPAVLDRLLRVLAHVREVRVNAEPVRVVADPIDLALVVADDDSGGVRFWIERASKKPDEEAKTEQPAKRLPPQEGPIPGLRHYVPAFPGWVHSIDGTLRPLTPEGTRLLRVFGAATVENLPVVEAAELDRFREREWPLIASRYKMEVATETLPKVVAPPPEPRLYLVEPEEMALEIRPGFAYSLPDGAVIEAGRDSPHFLTAEDTEGTQVQRNSAREAELLAQVLTAVASAQGIDPSELGPDIDPWNLYISGEDALAFLAEQMPLLEETFAILGDESLQRLKVNRSGLEASVRVKSHMDWFDLKMGFSSGDALASAAEVLKAWKKQRRFVRMNDGSYARIPDKWLARYGMLMEEAEGAKRELRGRLPRYMASLGAALEGAVGSFEGDSRFGQWKDLLAKKDDLPEVPLPKRLKAELRPYQVHGYHWLCWLADQGFGGCLADDMGLGKTVQALAFIQRQKEMGRTDGRPVLVVAPTSVLFNWREEAKRFTPNLKVVIYQGMHRKEVYNPTQNPQPDIVVTSYPVLRIDAELLWGINWHAAILDESQHIKNAESQTAHAAFRLKAKHRFVMTGTPLENRLDDLWSQYNFVMPGFLGRRKSFLQNYSVRPGSVTLDAETLKARLGSLRDRILPFLLRRLKQDVATELPERTEMSLHVELSEAEQRIYATVRDAYRAQVFSAMSEQGRRGARLTILEALLRLRQASCHPSLLPFEEAKELGTQHGSSKIRTLVETLDEIVAEGHKALVFSQWTSLLDLAQEELTKAGIAQTRLDGSTRDREGVVNAFQAEDGPPVFLLSLKAGGTGLNLTAADYVLHLDPWWNPAVEAQANDRAHRIGQTRPVVVIKLVAAGTVEEKVVSLQRQKRALFDATVSQAKSLEDMLSDDDLKALLADGDDSGLAGAAGAPPPPRAAKTVKRKAPAKKGSDDAAKPPPDSAPPPPARKTVRRRRSPAPAKSRADAPKSREAPGAPEASSPSGDPMLNSIMDLVRDREGVTTREVQDLLGLSSDDALLALRDLIARGLITRTGRGPSVRYLPAEAA